MFIGAINVTGVKGSVSLQKSLGNIYQ